MRILIVDGEPLVRRRIRGLLERERDVESIAECGHGEAAVAFMRTVELDLVLMDVQLPGLDGFGVLDRLLPERSPQVIFVTAGEQHARRAFDVQACDYLLKPVAPERFARALQRARAWLGAEGTRRPGPARSPSPSVGGTPARGLDVLAVKLRDRILPVRTGEIDWVEAEGNYVHLHIGRASHLLRCTIASLEASLDSWRFRRIHRSAIVNVDRIRELHRWFRKDYRVILADGTELTLSRTYTHRFPEFLGTA